MAKLKDRPDSAIKQWLQSGGKLSRSARFRLAHPEQYPYMIADKLPKAQAGAIFSMLMVLAGAVFYCRYVGLLGSDIPFLRSGESALANIVTEQAPLLTDLQALLPTEEASYADIYTADLLKPTLGADQLDQLGLLPVLGVTPSSETPILVETFSPSPTLTVTPTFTPSATVTPSATPFCDRCASQVMAVRLGWFYPPLGGAHCTNGTICENDRLTSGRDWLPLVGTVLACPLNLEEAWVEIMGVGVFRCQHTLPVLTCNWQQNYCDVSLLNNGPLVGAEDWRQVREAVLWFGR